MTEPKTILIPDCRPETSPHREKCAAMEARWLKAGSAAPFTRPPEAVLKRVLHALESPRPKARYPVTVPTYSAPRRLVEIPLVCLKFGRVSMNVVARFPLYV